MLGTACGPYPYPEMVSYFQSIIGREARNQILEQAGKLPTRVYACVGGGSNALGIFNGFLDDAVSWWVLKPPARGFTRANTRPGWHLKTAAPALPRGTKPTSFKNEDGQMKDTHSVAAGLDYIGVSPILASLGEKGRVRFEATTDREVIDALSLTLKTEGLIPALESAHAFAQAFKEAPSLSKDDVLLINQSGRGDKDILPSPMPLRTRAGKHLFRKKRRTTVLETI